jgi:hypothetical protein
MQEGGMNEALEIESRQPKSRSKNHEPMVYFLQRDIDGFIKIGTTTNITDRITSIQTGAGPCVLLGRILGGPITEARLHQKFADSRQHGEWFLPTDDLMDVIKKSTTRT